MQLENYRDADGRRVRLTNDERNRLLEEYDDGTDERLAMELMSRCGLRSAEVLDVGPEDVVRGDDTDQWFLRVPEGKGDKERMTPMPATLAGYCRAQGSSPILDVTTRTLRRWVGRAAQRRSTAENDSRWEYVRPHDLRRTWGHLMLESGVQASVLMEFGGWSDYQTFQRHYLGKHSEATKAREAEKVGWL